MGKHRSALAAAIFGLATTSYAFTPYSQQEMSPYSDGKTTRFYEYLESMFNMF